MDNANSLLDKADLVFIDPVGTGFSRAAGKAQNKDFWGIDQDVKSLAQFITIYISRNSRWNSPKFLIGESYGTFRSAALGNYLQDHDGVYLNGIVLISTVLDLSTLRFNPGDDMSYIFYVPSYAASAWYYKILKNRPDDLNAFLKDARHFASTEYAAALMKGSNLSDAEKADVAKKLADFTGLSEDYLVKADLRVTLSQFEAELERSRGLTVGRYDSRYSGPTFDLLTEGAEYDPSYSAVSGAFTAALNSYLREDLKFNPEMTYKTLSGDDIPQLGLETQYGRRVARPLFGERRKRHGERVHRQSEPAGAGREWILRHGDAVLRHRIHDGPSRVAREPTQPHSLRVLRVGPHDVSEREGTPQPEEQHRELHRQRDEAIAACESASPRARRCHERTALRPRDRSNPACRP